MSGSNISEASSKIVFQVIGFKLFPRPGVKIRVTKEHARDPVTVIALRKNEKYTYTLTVKAEVHT